MSRTCSATILVASLAAVTGVAGVVPVAAADDDPRRPAAIEAKEVPVVPADIYSRLAQYQSVRNAAFRGWAPDGRGILIATRFGNSSQLHRVFEPGGRREQITFFEEPASGSFLPEAKDDAVLITMDTGGNENSQVYLLEPRAHRTTLLTDGKSRHSLQAVRKDGRQIVVSHNGRNGRDMDFYIADPRQAGSPRLLMQVDRQTWGAADWSVDGKTLLISRYVSINESYPALLDVETGKRTDLPRPADETAAYGPMAFAPDGKSIYVATDAGGEFRRLARLDLATGKYDWLSDDIPWDVADLIVEPRTGDVVFSVNEDGASRLYWIPQGKGARKTIELPLGIVGSIEFSPDGKQLGLSLARPDAPTDAYSVRLSDNQLTRWTFSEVGGLDPASFVAPTRIQFTSFDDRKIPAYYFKPRSAAADRKAPVLINIHGGPESQYRPFFTGTTQYQVSELGVAVICPNVRGSAGYGKTYLKLDNAEKREDSVRDIGALLDWIAAQPELDANRVAVIGGSYGGYMVLASLTHYPERIRAGVDIVGIANFLTFLERTAGYRVDLRRAEYGDERDPRMRATFERISPLNNADKIRSRLLVIHGRNDPRVPFFEAEQIAAKVRGQGRPVWTVFADNEGHGFAKKDNSDYSTAVIAMFLKQNL